MKTKNIILICWALVCLGIGTYYCQKELNQVNAIEKKQERCIEKLDSLIANSKELNNL